MKKSSIYCCGGFCLLLLAALVVLLIFAPQLARLYSSFRGLNDEVCGAMLAAFYICSVPAAAALLCLLMLLRNISAGQPFSKQNGTLMAAVSWCCVAVAVVTAAAGFWYMPMLFVTAAMLFIFLIVRVVRGCFLAAAVLKEENSLTI